MILQKFLDKKLIHPPIWMPNNCMYLTIMGSRAYGCEKPDSDFDIYGFAVPPKSNVFSHLNGEIQGFGQNTKPYQQWDEKGLTHPDSGAEWSFTVYSIVKYFHLVMGGNPNMVDSLFTPINCVIHTTQIGNLVRDNRKKFLSKRLFLNIRNYANSQIHKMNLKQPEGLDKILAFETSHNLSHSITKEMIKKELEKRGIDTNFL